MTKQNGGPVKDSGVWPAAGMAFVGLCVVGAGIGKLVGDVSTWSTIGAGVGFLVIAVLIFTKR